MNRLCLIVITGVVVPLLLLSACGGGEKNAGNPDILLIVIDSIRPDHLSMNGYHRETTPVLDSLASTGAVWTDMQAQSSWSLPAMASILTGLTQRSHMAGQYNGEFHGIDPSLPTLPLLLQRGARYQTAAFFNTVLMSESFGFSGGFHHFDCSRLAGKDRLRTASGTVDDFLAWYDEERDRSRPLFAVVHFSDPSPPFSPPSPWDTLYAHPKADRTFNRFWGTGNQTAYFNRGQVEIDQAQLDILAGLYDGELSFTDTQTGRLIAGLRARDGLNNTVFVITGSHGQEFLDHGGLGYGHTLYQELLHVPLIVSGSGIPSGERTEVAAQIDILPTLLAIPGLERPVWADGRDLFGSVSQLESRYIPSSNLLHGPRDRASVRLADGIVIGNPADRDAVFFQLCPDPEQREPMVPSRGSLDELYYYWSLTPRGDPPAVQLDNSMRRELWYLGYLD